MTLPMWSRITLLGITRSKTVGKKRTDEVPFVFKSTHNPASEVIVNTIKEKSRKSKRSMQLGLTTSAGHSGDPRSSTQ